MTSFFDMPQERQAHIDQRLRTEKIAWLISVRPDGRLHAVPVGFLWDGESAWIFTRPNTQKLRNIRNNAQVLLVLDDTHGGIDPISLEGTATLLATESVQAKLTMFAEKSPGRFGLTQEGLAARYSQAICITPTRIIGLTSIARRT